MDLRTALRAVFLSAAGEDPLTFPKGAALFLSKPLVMRCPYSWILLFEDRAVTSVCFVDADRMSGTLSTTFLKAGRQVFSADRRAPFTVCDATESLLMRLQGYFEGLGVLYCVVPLPPIGEGGREPFCQKLLTILKPLIMESMEVIATLNGILLTTADGHGERYMAYAKVNPAMFPVADREAIKRAITRAEQPLDRRGPQNAPGGKRDKRRRDDVVAAEGGTEKTCRACGGKFSGSWSRHKREQCPGMK